MKFHIKIHISGNLAALLQEKGEYLNNPGYSPLIHNKKIHSISVGTPAHLQKCFEYTAKPLVVNTNRYTSVRGVAANMLGGPYRPFL
jgi:hypothetical protein